MKTVFDFSFLKSSGIMVFHRKKDEKPYCEMLCPFMPPFEFKGRVNANICNRNCAHCGDVETDANGKKRVILTCGCGTEIREEGFDLPNF